MDSKRYFLLLLGAFGIFRCALAAGLGGWLTPAHKEDAPYILKDAAGTSISSIVFPDALYKGWTIFNASLESSEAPYTYEVRDDALCFSEANTQGETSGFKLDEQAYLSLGISADDTAFEPIRLVPSTAGTRFDYFYAKVRFAYSDTFPDMDATDKNGAPLHLREMYTSYDDRFTDPETGERHLSVSAKLGICILPDGYFYISRARSLNGTGEPDDFKFEFCRTKYTYKDLGCESVGSEPITICLEFQTYLADATDPYAEMNCVRGYRIFAKASGSSWLCLSSNRGYKWISGGENGYAVDFSSLEKGSGEDDDDHGWLYPIDNAYAAYVLSEADRTGEELFIDATGIHSVQQLAFAATDGAFLSAWMKLAETQPQDFPVEEPSDLEGYILGGFEPFVKADPADPALAAWLAGYGVDLTDYLSKTDDRSTDPFNAFLLNMDPATAGSDLDLLITGIVPDEAANTVMLTVVAPEGSEPVNGAAYLCVSRAETLEGLATAEPVYYKDSETVPDADNLNRVTLTIPYELTLDAGSQRQYPFMKVTLLSRRNDPPITVYSTP